ncbi:MAG: hypothetical protein JJU00_05900 [Opitutales bacterium]|nr:hypothetical protein [Opitutales bacterium]
MRYHREEYLSHMLGEGTGREILVELFGPLVGLEAEWRKQGASEDELSLDAFDFDSVEFVWIGNANLRGDRTPGVEYDSPEYSIHRDELGRRMKLIKATATLPLPMDYPVETADDWQKIRHWLADHESRVNEEACRAARKRHEAGALVGFGMLGGFDLPRKLMGEENACMAFIDEPEMIVEMLSAAAGMTCAVIDRIAAHCPIDYLHVHEDFAGKSGPLIGPAMISAYMKPYYTRVWEHAREAGAKIFSVDTDGNVNPVIDALLDAGINQIYPMEPAAGMDIVSLRAKYGRRLLMKGGIDKHVLRSTQEAIRAELEYKLQPAIRGGGIVFGLDHRIPNGTPIGNYRFYVRTARELLGLPPAQTRKGSWRRMAF